MRIRAALLALAIALAGPGAGAAPPPAAKPAEAVYTAEEVRADLDFLYRTLEQAHFDLFARRPRAEYDRLHRRLRAEVKGPLGRDEAVRLFQRFMAFGQIAHSRIDEAPAAYGRHTDGGGKVFPLRVRWADDRAFITRDGSGSDLAAEGDELLAIEGRPVGWWVERAARYVSADTRYMLRGLLEWDLPMVIWNELGPKPDFAVRLSKPGGRIVELTVPARSDAELKQAADSGPPRLRLGFETRDTRMLAGGVAYLRPGPFYNGEGPPERMYDSAAFVRFIDDAFAGFLKAGATSLIVDLRDNPGGDHSFSDHMIAWFATRPFKFSASSTIRVSPQSTESNRRRLEIAGNDPTGMSRKLEEAYARARPGERILFDIPMASPRNGEFRGRVFVLVNRHSYSNAVNAAALIQDYGFGTILGEETADLATTYGAMETFRLPRTGIEIGYPKSRIVRPSGSLKARGVVPDRPIATPIVEPPSDPVLERAAEIARSG